MFPYLIKAMRKFYISNNIIYQKYEPTQSLIYSIVCYQFDIYLYVGSFDEEWTEDMEKKNFDLLQSIIPEMIRILLDFFIFSYLQWNMITTSFSSSWKFLVF